MKKLFTIIFISLTLSYFFAMSKQQTNKITGYIHLYENEPFSFIGFQADNNKEYSLSIPESLSENSNITTQSLNNLQGMHLELQGTIIPCETTVPLPRELKDGTFIIDKIKIIKD